jgi:hypothetical protein
LHRGHVALEDVQVGPADGGRVDPDDDVAVVEDLGVRYFFPGLLSGTVVDEGSHGFLRWARRLPSPVSSAGAADGRVEGPFCPVEG